MTYVDRNALQRWKMRFPDRVQNCLDEFFSGRSPAESPEDSSLLYAKVIVDRSREDDAYRGRLGKLVDAYCAITRWRL